MSTLQQAAAGSVRARRPGGRPHVILNPITILGALVALVGVGGLEPDIPAAVIGRMLPYYRMELVGQVSAQGAAACFTCGLGEHCRNGAIHLLFGPDAKITDEMIPNLANQPEKLACARALGEKLRNRFIQSHPTEPSPNAHRQSQQHP